MKTTYIYMSFYNHFASFDHLHLISFDLSLLISIIIAYINDF